MKQQRRDSRRGRRPNPRQHTHHPKYQPGVSVHPGGRLLLRGRSGLLPDKAPLRQGQGLPVPPPSGSPESEIPSVLPKENRPKPLAQGESKSAVPPEFPLRDTRLPSNGGPPSRLTPRSAAPLRDDFPRRLADAFTNRVLSGPWQTGYCFPSLRLYGR